MSWHWKELLPVDRYIVRTNDQLHDLDQKVLTLLYQPLIGALSYSLYMTLWSELERDQFISEEKAHRQLMVMMDVPLHQIFEERKKLEAIGLLKTFKQKDEETTLYLYELQCPLSSSAFFQDDVLSVYLYNRLGKNSYRKIRERFTIDKLDSEQFVELTRSFDEVFTSLHHSEIVSTLQESEMTEGLKLPADKEYLKREQKSMSFQEESFDFALLEADLSGFITTKESLTPEVKQVILRLAYVYRIPPLEMSSIIQRAMIHDDKLDIAELRKKVQAWYKLEHGSEPPTLALKVHPKQYRTVTKDSIRSEEEQAIYYYETTSPIALLESRSDGAKVPPADVKIVEGLILDYQLLPGVANVLLDYVLMSNDMKLTKAFIDKIAGHWARKNIKTVKEAMELAKSEHRRNEKLKAEAGKRNRNRSTFRQGQKQVRKDTLPKWLIDEQEKTNEQTPVVDEEFERQKREFEAMLQRNKNNGEV